MSVSCFTLVAMELDEKKAFSERLKLALRRSFKTVHTPSELALQFNLRNDTQEDGTVTPQAAQKWLTGKAKPTADKIQILADWLGVSAHWLSYGEPDARPEGQSDRAMASDESITDLPEAEVELLSRFRRLSPVRQQLVRDLVIELALDQEVWPTSKSKFD